ncbi:MAG: AAA family ATPase, partial [Myxococcales bacterium]|nr:AAA family ATPase [Myxococcales bacterium]
MENYRGFASLDLALHPRLNVLIGPNGAGKSSVLRALGMMLAHLQGASSFPPLDDAVRAGSIRFAVEIGLVVQGMACDWLLKGDAGSGVATIDPDPRPLEAKRPVLRSLAPNRYLESAVARPKGQALEDEDFDVANRFRAFIDWFRDTEDRENELRLSRDDNASYRDPTLQAVRKGLSTFLGHIPGARYGRLRITRVGENVPMSGLMMLEKDGQSLPLDAFSDGEATLILTVGDIAHSLAEANRGSDDPLAGEGIVLIDGVELHLHPSWQRAVLPALTATFPGIQFIVTTHSPQVIGEVARESVISLRDFRVVSTPPTFGKDVNALLETVMGASRR